MSDEQMQFEAEDLKYHIEQALKDDEQEGLDLESAQGMLGIKSVDKEYAALKEKAQSEAFQFKATNTKARLRPYQTQTIENLDRLLKEEFGTVAVQLPTGSGKTFLIHSYIHDAYLKKTKNVLIITPSWEIAHQHAMTMSQQFKDGRQRICRLGGRDQLISVFDEFRPGMKGKVILTTSALFYARRSSLKLKVQLIVIDEGHYGWRKKRLNSIQALARALKAPSVLLTATPPQSMENLPFASQLRYLDLVPEYLVECQVVRLNTGEEFSPVIRNGTLAQKSRVELSSRKQRFEKIVSDSIHHIKGQTIYYAGSVREAMGVVAEYAKHGLLATVVHSKWLTKGDKINAIAIEKFRKGDVQVLVNVQMLAMGFDVPKVETIIVARPVESDTLFTQMVGRGARPADGKSQFILIDVHDTIFKPDVAKIFEHQHLFYGKDTPEQIPEAAVEAPVVIETIDVESVIDGFPWSDPETDLDFESFHFLRSQALLTYFTKQDSPSP